MELIDKYIDYLSGVRRFSERTLQIYRGVLEDFNAYLDTTELLDGLTPQVLRAYEVHLLENKHLGSRTVGLYMSALSSFAKYLTKEGLIKSNPVKAVSRPKTEKLLPIFYREESMTSYFKDTALYGSEDALLLINGRNTSNEYEKVLKRLIVSLLFFTGIRRSELISIRLRDIDFSRETLKVRGKGDKTREIPLEPHLIREISLYLQAQSLMDISSKDALLITPSGRPLYPNYVDRAVKGELGKEASITARKSPHVLRHTIATELLNEGAELNSIKEMLGHSSLAATQVYTHNSIEKLKKTYNQAHPLCQDLKE